MNDHRRLDKTRSRRRFIRNENMNNENASTYTLLVRSAEAGRSFLETAVYALLGLSVMVSILQFVQQHDRLPVRLTSPAYEAARFTQHHAQKALDTRS